MKKIIYVILACVMLSTGADKSFANPLREDDEVELRKKGGGVGNGPKTSSTIPIICLLNNVSSTISSSIIGSFGQVTIIVENQTTGIIYQDCFIGSHLLYLPDAGMYTVSYVMISGDVYEGTFLL